MNAARVRGLVPDDDRFFAAPQIQKLKAAQEELRFLLDRGYPLKSAGTFVGSHHQLTSRQLIALQRCTASTQSLATRRRKQLTAESLIDKTVNIDGFNIIINLEVALSNGMLFIGQDSGIRDLAELRGTYRLIPQTDTAISIIRDTLISLKVSSAVIMLDEPVSNSGRLKTKIYDIEWPFPLDVQIIRSPDAALKQLPCVLSGDSIILDECISWFNLMKYIINTREELSGLDRLVDLS